MRIEFERSGGFGAAPGLEVGATVTLDRSEGEVVAAPDYRRPLESDECVLLADTAATLVTTASAGSVASERVSPDAFEFRLVIEAGDGRHTEISIQGQSRMPALARLIDWASREADRIVRERVRSARRRSP